MLLASSSPRRRLLLQAAGLQFDLVRPGNEPDFPGVEPRTRAVMKARAKAQGAQSGECVPAKPVLGVDTMVLHLGVVHGKPGSPAEAKRVLQALAGETHEVLTAHWLETWIPEGSSAAYANAFPRSCGIGFAECAVAQVAMAPWPAAQSEYEAWIHGGGWSDKAGGYGLQEPACSFATMRSGATDTVVGLHVAAVQRLLRASRRLHRG